MTVDAGSSEQQLARAAALLHGDAGVIVMADAGIVLRVTPTALLCDIVDPAAAAHRCEEEFRVMIENASRQLAASPIASRLPSKPLHWRVVEDDGGTMRVVWPDRGDQ